MCSVERRCENKMEKSREIWHLEALLYRGLQVSQHIGSAVKIDHGAKRNRQRSERNSRAPIGESRRFASDEEARDHLAAGVGKESQEVTLRNGISLPTAVELIAKINIHYCNYFLRRGRAESHDPRAVNGDEGRGAKKETAEWEWEGDRARERQDERKEDEDGPRPGISVTRVSLTWSSCPWWVNYKVEPTIPSLAKRNRWIQLLPAAAGRWPRRDESSFASVASRSRDPNASSRNEKKSIRAAGDWSAHSRDATDCSCKKELRLDFNYPRGIHLKNLLMGPRSMKRLSVRAPAIYGERSNLWKS